MIALTLLESSSQIVSGIPEFVEIGSEPEGASVFYTLDGSTPSEDSILSVGSIYLPTNSGTVTIKAIAFLDSESSSILEHEFATDSTGLDAPRRVSADGVVVMLSGSEVEESLSVNLLGEASQSASVPFSELDMRGSTQNSDGSPITGGGTSLPFVNFAKTSHIDDRFSTSSVNGNHLFDPTSKVLVIDGSTEELLENQVVKMVNRTYNTFEPVTKFYTERLAQSEPIITGNLIKGFFNPKTNEYISYYWESLESRWLISKQKIEPKKRGKYPPSRNKFVFRWIDDRSGSSAL